MTRMIMALCLALLVSAPVVHAQSESGADPTIEELLEGLTPPLKARIDIGEITEIDYIKRKAIISGYVYYFPPDWWQTPPKFKLLGSDAGALQLMTVGMKVEVTYGDTPDGRIGLIVEQLPDSTEVAH